MIKVERIVNTMATEHCGDLLDAVMDGMTEQVDGNQIASYRVAFPVFHNQGRMMNCICLVAHVQHSKLSMILRVNGMKVSPTATHVMLFHAYEDRREWLRQAKGIIRFFPEQPHLPEFVVQQA